MMISSQGHSGDAQGLIFPAIIVSSVPFDRPDESETTFRFPRIYEWLATSTAHVCAPSLVMAPRVPFGPCLNAIDRRGSWARNISEEYYDPLINNRPVPNGMPVTICVGMPKPIYVRSPDCNIPVITPVLQCAMPSGMWFSHWVDPTSMICNV